ncbi:MAG: phosphoribosylamine--glycine ligase [Propionibacterium sp.]|nr:phosphoribosylamine--glycine ligase [Propionibacterium sp.]
MSSPTILNTPATVLVVGNGGREHALALGLARDPAVTSLHCAPGNPGTARIATNHEVDPLDGHALTALARELAADLVVIGPEAPLVAGVADVLRAAGFVVFGPSRDAALIEGSKAFAKQIMDAAGVPTAASRVCTTPEQAAAALDEFGAPYVVKDDGLAAGKGVVVTDDRVAALAHAASCERVVIEAYLDGPEVSLFAITDGTVALPMRPAQDFKRVGDGDQGPNTGGMGAYSPLPWAPASLVETVQRTVIEPTISELARRGTPFVGLLYAGLALTSKGLRVVEFNARFGDPETQVLIPQLATPLGQVLYAAGSGRLTEMGPLTWHDGAAVGVVLAARGYPGTPEKGAPITLPDDTDTAHVVHAGTALDEQGRLVASGGRVLTVVARGDDLASAREAAYEMVGRVGFPGGFHRDDIALSALAAPAITTL